MKKFDRDPESFDEDDMPCMCSVCSGWFDLSDGVTNPRKETEVICEKCADEIQVEVEREEEIEELTDTYHDAKITMRDCLSRLKELNAKMPDDGDA